MQNSCSHFSSINHLLRICSMWNVETALNFSFVKTFVFKYLPRGRRLELDFSVFSCFLSFHWNGEEIFPDEEAKISGRRSQKSDSFVNEP